MYMRSEMFGGYMHSPFFMGGIGFLALWDLAWRGIAMWRAARRKEPWWFVALMLVNSVGILPIVYLLVWGKDEEATRTVKTVVKTVSKKKKRG